MNCPIPKRLTFALLGAAAALAISPVYADDLSITDQAILSLNGVAVETLTLDENAERAGQRTIFFSDTNLQFFNQDAGEIIFLEARATAPTGTFTIGQDSIASTGVSFKDVSDLFGVNNTTQNDLHRVGYMSSGRLKRYETFGVPGQSFTYLVEKGSLQDISQRFLTQEAIDAGYTLEFSSDAKIPEPSTTVLLLTALAGFALLHRKLNAATKI
jgi:hypothetical protein